MKNSLLILPLFLLMAASVLAQEEVKPQGYQISSEDQYDNLMETSKRKKANAWISVAGGAGLSILGRNLYTQQNVESPGATAAYAVSATGIVSTPVSILLFLSAAKDRREAKVLLKNEVTGFHLPPTDSWLPSYGVQLPLSGIPLHP
jgi:hypothetical protein